MPMPWKAVARAVVARLVYDMKPQCSGYPPPPATNRYGASGAAARTMRIAPNGQRTAHSAHPVQPGASCSVEPLGPQGSGPGTCSDSTCGAHTATHQPQPVQRWGSMAGKALRGAVVMGP